MASRMRADELLVAKGLAASRSQAKALITSGEVRVGDRIIEKPAELIENDTQLELRGRLPFVSRGGLKLDHALTAFALDVTGAVTADIGASTGGFTDCLLQRGAARVYAIDVGYGQLDYRLRNDERVVVMERVNARHLTTLPELIDFVCVDVSFISLEHILPTAAAILRDCGDLITLVKPQFEAGRESVGRGGVIRDDRVRRSTVDSVISLAGGRGLGFLGLERSPVIGPAGNNEFLAWFRKGSPGVDSNPVVRSVFTNRDV